MKREMVKEIHRERCIKGRGSEEEKGFKRLECVWGDVKERERRRDDPRKLLRESVLREPRKGEGEFAGKEKKGGKFCLGRDTYEEQQRTQRRLRKVKNGRKAAGTNAPEEGKPKGGRRVGKLSMQWKRGP